MPLASRRATPRGAPLAGSEVTGCLLCVSSRAWAWARTSVTIWENSCWVNNLIIRIFVPLALGPVVVHALVFSVIVPIPFVYYRMTFHMTLGVFYAFVE